jgi:hypothetical protein
VIVWLPLLAVITVIETPTTPVTSPLTAGMTGWPDGAARGEASGDALGDALGPNRPVPHPVEGLGDSRTVVAVNMPAESFWPVAIRHKPGTMSASTAVEVREKVVVLLIVTVTSPVAPVRIRVWPFT